MPKTKVLIQKINAAEQEGKVFFTLNVANQRDNLYKMKMRRMYGFYSLFLSHSR